MNSVMNCEICGKPTGAISILPIKRKKGHYTTLVCDACAEASGVFCVKRNRPYKGFEDDTAACLVCIEEMVDSEKSRSLEILNVIRNALSVKAVEMLMEWAGITSAISGNSESICVLRAVATKAARFKQSIDEVLQLIEETNDLTIIVPYPAI